MSHDTEGPPRSPQEQPCGDDEPMARLLREAGVRPAVPQETSARVRSAVHAHWREQTRVFRRRRIVLWAGCSIAAAAAIVVAIRPGGWFPKAPPPGTTGPIATVQRAEGSVRREGGGPLRVGDRLAAGSEVATGADGRVALALAGGESVRLDRDTQVRLEPRAVLSLSRGAVYVDSGTRSARRSPLAVRTEMGTVRDVGTQFEVRLEDDTLQVSVREGAAHLTHGGRPFEIRAGTRLRVNMEGSAETRPLAAGDSDWSWILAIAPPFDLEGRTLSEYLDWVSRETGWRVQFAEPSIEQAAVRETLHGSIQGLRPDETPAAVLPTCGLRHRLTGGTLVVERLEPPGRRP
jgi:hypothetical protein